VLPELSWCSDGAWARTVDHKLEDIPTLNVACFPKKPVARMADSPNGQSPEIFAAEQSRLRDAFTPLRWIRPSDADPEIVQFVTASAVAPDQPVETVAVTEGSSFRGIILHKLMEELLTGELASMAEPVQQRAAILIVQLTSAGAVASAVDPEELTQTALRTFALPELATDRDGLVAEVPVYGLIAGDAKRFVSGRADAVRYRDGRARVVFDWKSDIAPEPATRSAYAHQLALYVEVLAAERGAIVYMTSGQIEWIEPARQRLDRLNP
jgi:CRISPR-associated exonuclease Cas4